MKIMKHDTPLNEGKSGSVTVGADDKPLTARKAAMIYGLHPAAIHTFKKRHPECSDWSLDQICQQMVENKDQSAVAKRQGCESGGRRGRFGRITYS